MEVLARLTPPLLSHLRASLHDTHSVTAASDWNALMEIARDRAIDIAFVDPRAAGSGGSSEIRGLLLMYPSLPVVLYSTLSPEAVRATAELAPLGVHQVLLRGFDDDPPRLRDTIDQLVFYGVGDALLQRLVPKVASGPPLLLRALVRLFREPQQFGSVSDLAAAASLSRRTLDRWLGRQGVASARTLIALARLARAYHYLRDPGCMAEDVARKMGYASPRVFASQTREVTGLNPSVLRQVLSPEAFTERLAALLWHRPENETDVRPEKARTRR